MSISKSLSGFVRTRTRNAQHNLGIGVRVRIMDILDSTHFTNRRMETEKKACDRIAEALLEYRSELGSVSQQHTIEKGGRVDIVVGDEQNYGIEVKLLKALKSVAARDKLHGQLKRYCARYDCKLMLIVVGDERQEDDPILDELEQWAEDLHVDFYYFRTYPK